MSKETEPSKSRFKSCNVGKLKEAESAQIVDSFMDSFPDAFLLLDENLNLMRLNPAAQRILGLFAEEAVGKNISDAIPGIKESGRYGAYLQVIKTGKPFYADDIVPQSRFGDKGLTVKAFKVGNGLGLIASEVTLRNLEQQAIPDALEYANSIIDTVPSPLLVLDGDLRISSASRSFYQAFKVTPEETIGQFIYDLGNRQWNVPKLRELLEDILPKHSFIEEFEVEHNFPSLGLRVMLLNARRVLRKPNGDQFILLVVKDITNRKLMEQKLLASEHLASLGHFSGSMAHEIRNSLATISSSAYYLKTKLGDADAKVQTHLERIKSGVDSAGNIIQSLQNLTQTKEPNLDKLDLRTIASGVTSPDKVPPTVQVIHNLPEQEVEVHADLQQLRMAFRNIVENAVQAMNGKGTLTTSVRTTPDGQAEVSFSDTGPGISPENLERIFEPLFSTKAKGIGFGLSIAKMVVDKHGGTIQAKSEQGKGATFIIRLPSHLDKGKEK